MLRLSFHRQVTWFKGNECWIHDLDEEQHANLLLSKIKFAVGGSLRVFERRILAQFFCIGTYLFIDYLKSSKAGCPNGSTQTTRNTQANWHKRITLTRAIVEWYFTQIWEQRSYGLNKWRHSENDFSIYHLSLPQRILYLQMDATT